jgi:hypothetical protein
VALTLKPGDELRLRVSAPTPVLALRIGPAPKAGYQLSLSSRVHGIPDRPLGHHATEAAVWGAIAKLTACWPVDVAPLPEAPYYDLSLVLVIEGTPVRTMEQQRFGSQAELWAGLADYAAGRQADLALEMAGREEDASRRGMGRR